MGAVVSVDSNDELLMVTKAMRELGVVRFKVEGVEVEFAPRPIALGDYTLAPMPPPPAKPMPAAEPPTDQQMSDAERERVFAAAFPEQR